MHGASSADSATKRPAFDVGPGGELTVARAPSAAQFPAYPASWYLLGWAHELRVGPVSKLMWGRRLVGYRTSAGVVVVLDGQCCHRGADLGCGRVVGDAVENQNQVTEQADSSGELYSPNHLLGANRVGSDAMNQGT